MDEYTRLRVSQHPEVFHSDKRDVLTAHPVRYAETAPRRRSIGPVHWRAWEVQHPRRCHFCPLLWLRRPKTGSPVHSFALHWGLMAIIFVRLWWQVEQSTVVCSEVMGLAGLDPWVAATSANPRLSCPTSCDLWTNGAGGIESQLLKDGLRSGRNLRGSITQVYTNMCPKGSLNHHGINQ
jgi:hypothetical protein